MSGHFKFKTVYIYTYAWDILEINVFVFFHNSKRPTLDSSKNIQSKFFYRMVISNLHKWLNLAFLLRI